MTRSRIVPAVMGALMGLMMLRMAHAAMTGESALAGFAFWGFILAHVAVVLAGLALAFWAARSAPAFKARLDRLHRPSWRHMAIMLGSASCAALAAHLYLHGGV